MDIGIAKLFDMQKDLMEKVPHHHRIRDEHQATVVASLGIIEEVMEYLNTIGVKSWRPNPLPQEEQLEEITDILFFFLELILLSGFKWDQITEQYKKKHAINLERYRKAIQGNFDWDLRGVKKGL